MKFLCIIAASMWLMPLQAQPAGHVKVRKVKWEVSIRPSDSILWVGKPNPVRIDVKGGDNYRVLVKGATIAKKANGYVMYATEEGAATISVYELLPQQKMRVLCTKLVPVQKIPPAQLFVCGVKQDSVIDKLQMIHENTLTVYHPFYKMDLPVAGFDMVFANGAGVQTLTSFNAHFTIDMRRRIYYIKSGTLVYFENIYYLLPDGTKEKIDNFEVFVSDSNKYNVGFRVTGL